MDHHFFFGEEFSLAESVLTKLKEDVHRLTTIQG